MFASVVDERLAGVRTHYVGRPSDINMRIPDQLIKCVGFISHHTPKLGYIGTVFIVAVRSADDPDGAYLHLVTAKHVAEYIDPGPFVIGMNARDGSKIMVQSSDEMRWFYHPTEKDSVDVAVMPFAPGMLPDYDLEYVPEIVFAKEEQFAEFGIGLGDEVFTVGLFTEYFGKARFSPLVRTGNIAMMPPEKIPLKGFGNAEAYLVEGRSIGGLSGSPVFVRHTVHMGGRTAKGEPTQISGIGPKIHLLGLMHGHWDLPLTFSEAEQAEAVNMGVAIVIPAKKILETLYHPGLVQMRKEYDEKERDKNLPVADIAKPKSKQFTQEDFDAALKKASRKVEK